MKQLTAGFIFCGAGGDTSGAVTAGYKGLWAVEFDKYAAAVYRRRFPTIQLIEEDITRLSDEFVLSLPVPDIIIGGSPCFVAGTQVLAIDGYKPIEKIEVGDLVLTHTGNWCPVIKTMVKENAPLREVKALGVHSLVTTDDHPFYALQRTKTWDNANMRYNYRLTEPIWTDACDLTKSSFLSQVLPPLVEDAHPESFWRMVGLYLADGWRRKRTDRGSDSGQVIICANKAQEKQVSEIIENAGFHAYCAEERTVLKFQITNSELYRFLEQFGHKAYGKKIPGWLLGLAPEKAKALIEGYVFGDGWISPAGYYRITSVSASLAYSVALLSQRAYNTIASVFCYERKDDCVIEGRLVNQLPEYMVQISFSNHSNKAFLKNDYGWKRVRQNTNLNTTGTVYNITVGGDESYVANGAIVHNCPDFSFAGTGAGLEGSRGQLFFEYVRFLRLIQPTAFVFENVDGILSHDNGETFKKIIWTFGQLGYMGTWQRRNGNRHVPQNRPRVFCVGIHRKCAGNPTEALQAITA